VPPHPLFIWQKGQGPHSDPKLSPKTAAEEQMAIPTSLNRNPCMLLSRFSPPPPPLSTPQLVLQLILVRLKFIIIVRVSHKAALRLR